MATVEDFKNDARAALVAAHGNSNDREISLLQNAVETAAGLLGVSMNDLYEEAYDEAEKKGLF